MRGRECLIHPRREGREEGEMDPENETLPFESVIVDMSPSTFYSIIGSSILSLSPFMIPPLFFPMNLLIYRFIQQDLNHSEHNQVTSTIRTFTMSSDSATSTDYTSLSSSTSSVDSLSTPPVSTTPPPSRSGSNASDSPTDTVLATTSVDDLSHSISSLNEYQVTSATQDDSENDSFDEKVLESDTFKWQELETFTPSSADFASSSSSSSSSSSIPPSVVLVDNEVVSHTPCELPSEECQNPLEEQQNDSDDSMPPLISESDESNTEDQEEEDEENEENEENEEDEDNEEEEEDEEDEENEEEEEDEEDEEEEDEEEVRDNKEEDQLIMVFRVQDHPTEVERGFPSFIHVIAFVFFFLHLFHYLELLTEKRERQNHPCFVFKY